ncbi:MAG: hypothetical protein K9J27_01180 [Bacteroidales bacterium]|nr:hypothetical protein [Bacteroidales bacterium]
MKKNHQTNLVFFITLSLAIISFYSCTKDIQPPEASFQAPQQVNVGEQVEFNAEESKPGTCNNCEIIRYYWDWEDDGKWDKTSDTSLVSYTFNEAKIYTVVLQVRNNQGEASKYTQKIEVQQGEGTNEPPDEPTLVMPEKGATGVSLTPTLEWSGSDPDGDPLVYNIYLGINSSPEMIESDYNGIVYNISDTLEENTPYYWRVEAKDEMGEVTESEKWTFTTEGSGPGANRPPNPPTSPYPESGDDNRPLNQILKWEANDPNGDELTYDIYMEALEQAPAEKPDLLKSDHPSNSINPTNYRNIQSNTTYYWLVIAKDGEYRSDSTLWHFTTGTNDTICPSEIPYNDTTIQTQKIGTQCWMAENLNHGQLLEPQENSSDNNTTEKYCYNTNENNCEEYGGLYKWDEVMGYSNNEEITGICPEGWHIPSEEEWHQLVEHLGGSFEAGKKLKAGGTSGFEGLMNGRMDENNAFKHLGDKGFFWSSTSTDNGKALQIKLHNDYDGVYFDFKSKGRANAVRCIKD